MNPKPQSLLTEALISQVATQAGKDARTTRAVLDSLTMVVKGALAEGKQVTIPGLVRIAPKHRAARHTRNPRTGESLQTPAKTVVAAHPLPALTTPQQA